MSTPTVRRTTASRLSKRSQIHTVRTAVKENGTQAHFQRPMPEDKPPIGSGIVKGFKDRNFWK